MALNSWRQWAKLTKKQLRQLGRVIDEELGGVIERNLPRPNGRLVKVPVPVPVRQAPPKFRASATTVSTRGYHQSAHQFVRSRLVRTDIRLVKSVPRVTMSSSAPRVPNGVPRGLFTNWNIIGRNAGQRMYSTASIKFTHEAVNNMAVSLRCFFNSLDGLIPPNNGSQLSGRFPGPVHGQAKLSSRDVSLIRDMELFEMIKYHKNEALLAEGEETVGAYVEFKAPQLDMNKAIPQKTFANSLALDVWRDEIWNYTNELKILERNVRRIYENYGSLPITTTKDSIRIHFPTLTMLETDKLITELEITMGNVYPDPQGPPSDILSNLDVSSDSDFSSVLSPSISNEAFSLV
ncbi:hypothetical protein ZYGR_0P03370 [Zygosaccharomyces rouxii]|uniref:Stationary phase protein 5 n=1 Tax=Zygosaccharomyces rouxii TaxID=4956 RepID=A0A1Q3A1V2_ZYGRO|nr:hypothetical protein ZYGR_0P03370 [Zygosaccharomyces rouxii]